jgi:hypothetical protein
VTAFQSGAVIAQRLFNSKTLLVLALVCCAFAQEPFDLTATVSNSAEDVALNDRRLAFITRLAEDEMFSHYLSRFQRAGAEEKIDVFIEAWGHAGRVLTELAEKRVSREVKRGLMGVALRSLGIGELDAALAMAKKEAERFDQRKREGELANAGLENAKALINRFIGAKEAAEFASSGPTGKTLLLLRALRIINEQQEQPGPFVMWTNDIGTPGHRGWAGRSAVRIMFGTDDRRYQGWDRLTRTERDSAVAASLGRYLDRAAEAVQDETGEKARALRTDIKGPRRKTPVEQMMESNPKFQKLMSSAGPLPQKEDLTYIRAFGTMPKTEREIAEVQRCGEVMEIAWRHGYYLLLGADDLTLRQPAR